MMPGRHELARAVDHGRAVGSASVGPPTACDLAVGQQDRAIVDPPALAVEDRSRRGSASGRCRIGAVGRRIGILVDPDRAAASASPSVRAGREARDRNDCRREPLSASAPRPRHQALASPVEVGAGRLRLAELASGPPGRGRVAAACRGASTASRSGDSASTTTADADRDPADHLVDRRAGPALLISPSWPPVASPILPATKLPTAVM